MAALPQSVHWLFPEVEPETIDIGAHADYILARVLERGRLADVKWAIAEFGLPRIHQFFQLAAHPEISERTRCFWRAVFRAEDEPWRSPPAWRRNNSAPWIS